MAAAAEPKIGTHLVHGDDRAVCTAWAEKICKESHEHKIACVVYDPLNNASKRVIKAQIAQSRRDGYGAIVVTYHGGPLDVVNLHSVFAKFTWAKQAPVP